MLHPLAAQVTVRDMSIKNAVNFEDLRRRAKRHAPKIAFDFIEGGVDDEQGLARNDEKLAQIALVPRYLGDPSIPVQQTTLFGKTYAHPFGIAPTGAAALFRQGADLMLARTAAAKNIPFIISGASTATMEEIAAVARDISWYQLYLAKDRKISEDMVRRADACGFSTLVLTVDTPTQVRRERNIRNGMGRPMKPTWKTKFEALLHPHWMYAYYTGPKLTVSNWAKYVPQARNEEEVLDFFASQIPAPATWDDVQWIRKMWPRNLVLKGILHPDDARRAASLGVDGIMVSNHGGRQLDRAPSPIEVLPTIVEAVGEKITIMFDSGIRRGSDIAVAMSMGAKFCWVGRWTLYGVTAGGQAGADHAADMVSNQLAAVMRQMGATNTTDFGPSFLLWNNAEDLRRNSRS